MEITEQDIKDLEERLAQAIKSRDLSKLNQFLHDDFLFIAPNGLTITKEMELSSHRSGTMIVEDLEVTFKDISIMDDCAVVMSVYQTKGRFMDMPIEGTFKYIRTWKKTLEGLKVISGSCVRLET
ncbi:nuclear transport factor 2 family protein [Myroides phaeus]|uniref:DUF4440 domain-containing protein n=1 Tax=Myroides phaeus TaxID=702745 RepID=A0A1G8H3P6_9FLAO|nr:nuclear transport factor 2 family protein [Myroides phaeus]MEC4116294.1 nuclear transport factor 2 family protein [Myroides phaeus]SDI01223.1 protein of unknown function [Myroides phaeus]